MCSTAPTTVWGKFDLTSSGQTQGSGSPGSPGSVSEFLSEIFTVFIFLRPLPSSVSPALGLAWANQVTVRLMMRRLQVTVSRGDQRSALRRLEVVFAPHLARSGQDAGVWKEGVRGVLSSDRD